MSKLDTLQSLKQKASFHYYGLRGKRVQNRRQLVKSGNPLVVGLLSSPIGLGEGARLVRRGLERAGYNVAVHDLTPVMQPHLSLINVEAGVPDDGVGPIILHVNPAEVPKAIHLLRERGLEHRRMIGIWAWELETLPGDWLASERWFDEIWSISRFSQRSFSKLSIPALHVGYPIEQARDDVPSHWRERLGLGNIFSVLVCFDARSSMARKNPLGAISAFKRAFPRLGSARLVLKVTGDIASVLANMDASQRTEIGDILSDPDIVIVPEILSSREMASLIRSCDCLLSLTRAEGFGLTVAQAAANGVPTVVTGWSAPADWQGCPNMNFVDFTLVDIEDASQIYAKKMGRWAEPNIDHAAQHLTAVAGLTRKERSILAGKSRDWWRAHHGVDAFEARMSDQTRALMQKHK